MTAEAIRAVNRDDAEYPRPLALVADAPATLWVAGAWRPGRRAVAVVGARAASGRGMERAEELGGRLARLGFDVISGGAIGIDAAAHRGALDAGDDLRAGRTVAVL